MVKKPKNFIQRLTSGDKELLEKVVAKYLVKYYNLTQQYPNPKKYVKEIVLNQAQSDKAMAILYTISYALNNPSNRVLLPGEINERLANDIRHTIQQDYFYTTDPYHKERFLHPRALRENVLRNLEKDRILLHLVGKKAITNYLNTITSPGRKPLLSRSQNERGGRWSGYTAAEEVEKLKRVWINPNL